MNKPDEILDEELSYEMLDILKKYPTFREWIKDAMWRYATEAIRADREKVAEKATIWVETAINGTEFDEVKNHEGTEFEEVITVYKDSILNLLIKLP